MLGKKVSSFTQQSVISNIKGLSIKLPKSIVCKAKASSASCALSAFLSAALCIASESGYHSINLLPASGYWDPELQRSWVTELAGNNFLPLPLRGQTLIEGWSTSFCLVPLMSCSEGHCSGCLCWDERTLPAQSASPRNRDNSGRRTFMIRWKLRGHCGVVERFRCWNY